MLKKIFRTIFIWRRQCTSWFIGITPWKIYWIFQTNAQVCRITFWIWRITPNSHPKIQTITSLEWPHHSTTIFFTPTLLTFTWKVNYDNKLTWGFLLCIWRHGSKEIDKQNCFAHCWRNLKGPEIDLSSVGGIWELEKEDVKSKSDQAYRWNFLRKNVDGNYLSQYLVNHGLC